MANFDLVETVRLPVFTEFWAGSAYDRYFSKQPYTIITVPVYEFAGDITGDEWTKFPYEGDLYNILSGVYNRISQYPYLAVLNNYSSFVENEYVYGTLVGYELNEADNIKHLRLYNNRGNLASYNPLHIESAFIIKVPTSGKYWCLYFQHSDTIIADYVKVSGITFDDPIDSLVDYTGNSDIPPLRDGVYDQGGISKPDGGDGTFDDGESDNIAMDIPDGSVEADSSSLGLFTRYAMTSSQIRALADKLYFDNFFEKVGAEVTKFLWNSPIEAVISCLSYPFSVTSLVGSTAVGNIKLGAIPTDLSGSALSGTFASIDWGSIQLDEYWGNFLDYAPHTKIELYLPWSTGFVEVDPHECLPGSIGVITNIELSKGTCQHIVTGNNGSVIGTFTGTCATSLPLTAQDSAGKAVALVTAAAGLAVAGAAGATGAARGASAAVTRKNAATSIGIGAAEAGRIAYRARIAAESVYDPIVSAGSKVAAVSSVASFRTPPHIVRNGSFNGNGSGMGIQYPFIILSRPTQDVPENYGHYYGYPSNIYTKLGAVSGYTEIASVHLDGVACTSLEKEEILSLLQGGVII